jgi:hypothetical protein
MYFVAECSVSYAERVRLLAEKEVNVMDSAELRGILTTRWIVEEPYPSFIQYVEFKDDGTGEMGHGDGMRIDALVNFEYRVDSLAHRIELEYQETFDSYGVRMYAPNPEYRRKGVGFDIAAGEFTIPRLGYEDFDFMTFKYRITFDKEVFPANYYDVEQLVYYMGYLSHDKREELPG